MGRMGSCGRGLWLVVVALLLAACSGASGTKATPEIIYVTPVPAPTPEIIYGTPAPAAATPVPTPTAFDPNLGKVSFGTHFDSTSLLIDRGSMTFSRWASQVCWSADLSAPPTHATIRKVVVSVSSGGVEKEIFSKNDEVTNPKYTLWANCEPFEAEVGYVSGSYILRFIDGVKVLAQGRFILVTSAPATPKPTAAPVASECIISIPEPGMTDHTPLVQEFLGWSQSQCAHAIAGGTRLAKAPATEPVCDVINKGTEIRVWGTDAARVACGLLTNP